jgi:DNA-binding beta-propeller fold protein YncE
MNRQDPNFPNGSRGLIAVDKVGNQILFLDPATFEVQTVLGGFTPRVHELALSPDGATAFIPIYGDGRHGANPHPAQSIVVVDVTSRTQLKELSVAPYVAPHGLRWGTGGELYCVCEDSGVVVVLDVATGAQIDVLDVGSTNAHRIEVLPDGTKLYTENEEDPWATVLDLKGRRRLADIPATGGLAGLGLHPYGHTVVLVSADRPALLVVDTSDDTIAATVRLSGHSRPAQIARFSPDGRHLVVTSDDEDVATILDAGLRHQVTVSTGRQPMDMAYAPDGRTVVIGNQGDGTLTVVDLEDGRATATVSAGAGVEALAFC